MASQDFRVVWDGSRLAWIGRRSTDRDAHGNAIRERWSRDASQNICPRNADTSSAGCRQNPMARRSGGLRKQLKSRMACAWRRWTVPLAWRLRRLLHARKRWGQGHSTHAAACDWIVGVIEWSRRQWRTEMRGAIAARKTRHLDRGMDDILDDAVPAYHDQPFVTA
jgi:hypothetical protein